MVEAWCAINGCTETDSYLHQANWVKHMDKRPEIRGLVEEVRETVEDPDFAIRGEGGVVFKYRKGYGHGKTEGLRLLVIEEADRRGAHYVKTVYFTPEIEDGEPLCIRRLW